MKPVITPDQAATLDRETQARGIPAELLMERAGRAVPLGRRRHGWGVRPASRRGLRKGNNGGDGFVAARHLARWGVRWPWSRWRTRATYESPPHATRSAWTRSADPHDALHAGDARSELLRADVAIDAVFGTGFRGVPEDEWADAIAALNTSSVPVIAVDIPSGVNGATGAVDGDAVRADLTVTFGAPKVGVAILPGAELAERCGSRISGSPGPPARGGVPDGAADVAAILPERDIDTHKRATGVLLVVAGSRDMTGAAHLVAEAAGRIGAGLVQVAVPQAILPIVQAQLVETTFLPCRRRPTARSPSRRSDCCSTGWRAPTRWRSVPASP